MFYNLCLKMIDHGSRSTWAQVLLDPDYMPNMCFTPTKTLVCYIFGFIKFSPSSTVEAVDAPQTLFRAPDPCFRARATSRRSRRNQIDYWEGTLKLLFNKFCLKMIDHGSRSTWGPGPSRSRLRVQKYDLPPLKQSFPTIFVL